MVKFPFDLGKHLLNPFTFCLHEENHSPSYLFLSVFAAHGQEPVPPTQEWCEGAFRQLPDHRDIAEVDANAFSVDFYTLVKIAFEVDEWEHQKNPGEAVVWLEVHFVEGKT